MSQTLPERSAIRPMFFTPQVKDERDEGNYCQGEVEYRS
jgi:hypothetical protein